MRVSPNPRSAIRVAAAFSIWSRRTSALTGARGLLAMVPPGGDPPRSVQEAGLNNQSAPRARLVPILEVQKDALASKLAGGAGHAPSGVGAGSALVVTLERGAVLAPSRCRPEEVHLGCEELPAEDVPLREPHRAFDVQRRHDLPVQDQVTEAGEERLESRLHGVAELVPLGVPVAILQLVRCALDEARHDVLARRSHVGV